MMCLKSSSSSRNVAVPLATDYTLECSDCGPLGTVTHDDLNDTALLHMAEHGIVSLPKITPWCDAGRKPLPQCATPPGGSPFGSGSTTNAGNDWLSVPSP